LQGISITRHKQRRDFEDNGENLKIDAAQIFSLLPSHLRMFGVVTQRRLLKLFTLYTLQVLLGSALLFLTQQQNSQVFGLGLIVPGGSFFAYADLASQTGMGYLVAALSILVLFIISLAIWFGTGNIIAPPVVWLGSAIWAASIRHAELKPHALITVYSIAGFMLCAIVIRILIQFKRAQKQRQLDNAYLLSQQNQLEAIFLPSRPEVMEMSLADLQRLRFALDRALQPVDEFNGFEWLDSFQTAAVRYQLNFLAYGLAMTQARFTPACAGYLHEAQVRLIEKQAQYKVWSYWQWENLWGNLQYDANPLQRENIMYTGFVALQMGLFAASTGRVDFNRDSSFKLQHPSGKHYSSDYSDLIERLIKEYQASDFFLIACEPNWIYPLCNMIGASAIAAYDAQQQHSRWQQHQANFRNALETEFLDGFGHYVPCRSARTGLALPAMGGVMPLAMPCFFLNAIAPDLAIRQWLLMRRQLFDKQSHFRLEAFWRIDTGNYGFSRASAYTATALAAAELGDQEVYQHCMQVLEEECPSVLKQGVIHRQRASVWAHGVELMARAVCKNSFQNLILQPRKLAEPYLEGFSYPDVLVASAHSHQDGLNAILYPGIQDGSYEIGLAGLNPLRHYCVGGAIDTAITADHQGKARFWLPLTGRTRLTVCPERRR
jgi:hypothetical protein